MRKPCAFDAKDRVCTALLCLGLAMLLTTTRAWAGDPPAAPAQPTTATSAASAHDVSELRDELNTALARIDELQKKLEQKQVSDQYEQKLAAEQAQIEAMQKKLEQVAYAPQDTTGAGSNL